MIDTANETIVRGTPNQCGSCGTERGNILGDIDKKTHERYGYLCARCHQLVRDFHGDVPRMRKVLAYSEDTRLGNGARCKNPNCGKLITPIPGHRPREYCNDTCKQTAYRLRKEQPHHGVTIVDESAQQRIAELERKVEVQGHNFDSSEQYAAMLEAELDRYRKIVDLDDRQAMIAQFMLTGEEIGYKALSSVDVRPGPHAWYAFSQTADTEHLAAAIVAARNVYKQLADLRTTTEVEKLNTLVAELRGKLRECEKGKRKQS